VIVNANRHVGSCRCPAPRSSRCAVAQVPSCGVNLNNEGTYSQRYKTCAAHRKSLSVLMGGGNEERFCQQCGRFEDISAFDGTNRWVLGRTSGLNDGSAPAGVESRAALLLQRRPMPLLGPAALGEQSTGWLPFPTFQLPTQELPHNAQAAQRAPARQAGRRDRRPAQGALLP
jgi:hypothetical protein